MSVRFADRVGDLRGGGRAHGVGGRGVIDDAVIVGVVDRFGHIARAGAVVADVLYPSRPGEVIRVRRFNRRGRVDLRPELQGIRRGQREARPGSIGSIGDIGVAADAVRAVRASFAVRAVLAVCALRNAEIEIEYLGSIIPGSCYRSGRSASGREAFNRNGRSSEARRRAGRTGLHLYCLSPLAAGAAFMVV